MDGHYLTVAHVYGLHLLRYQGIAVKRYHFTLNALQMKPIVTCKLQII